MILRARAVLPLSRPAIHDGAVWVSGNRIAGVGRWREVSASGRGKALDLGEAVLMPGLVNAHCHLDYTQMAGQFPPPKVFTDWLKLITAAKAGWSLAEFADSWRSGAGMLLRSGATTVADMEAVPELLPEVWRATPLRVFSFLELIAITGRRPPQAVLAEALSKLKALDHPRCRAGLAPHAPYSTVPELLRLSAQTAQRGSRRLCIHVAESALEYEMFTHGRGEMFDWLKRSGRDMADCGSGTPVRQLERCGVLDANLLLAHVNYLGPGDAALLARRRVSVVHCPRSHFYFRHAAFPLRRLARARVNICLGSDSLASVYKTRREAAELNMFEEMRVLAGREPALSPRTILRMATMAGARALGLAGRLGELSEGALADLIVLPLAGNSADVYEAVLGHKGEVMGSMIDGQWAIGPADRLPA